MLRSSADSGPSWRIPVHRLQQALLILGDSSGGADLLPDPLLHVDQSGGTAMLFRRVMKVHTLRS